METTISKLWAEMPALLYAQMGPMGSLLITLAYPVHILHFKVHVCLPAPIAPMLMFPQAGLSARTVLLQITRVRKAMCSN
jgi:hypothetical protein